MTSEPRVVVVGTAGHIDHGKSTLVRAITGIDPDRLREEKERGITIDLGFAHRQVEDVVLSFVDVPGHERFVHNMLAGASGIDVVLLVVAADESVMPQTVEHLEICDLLGSRGGAIALTRIDLADDDLAALAEEEVRELVAGTFLEGAPLVRVSGRTGEGVDELVAALVRVARELPPREEGPWPRVPIDRVFAAKGFGTVITGTLHGGALATGDEMVAAPGGPSARIRGLQVHGEARERVEPPARVAVNLQGVERSELRRGMVLVPPEGAVSTRVLDALVRVVDDAPVPLEHGMRVRVHHGTAEVLGRLRLPEPGRIRPGDEGVLQVRLEEPLALLPGDRFILRRYSPVITLAGGTVADLDPPRWRRADVAWNREVRALAGGGPADRLAVQVARAGRAGFPLERSPRLGIPRATAGDLAKRLEEEGRAVSLAGTRLLDPRAAEEIAGDLVEHLGGLHRAEPLEPGPPPELLRQRFAARWSSDEFAAFLDRLAAGERIAWTRESVRLPGHDPRLTPEQEAAVERILAILERAGLEAVPEDDLLREANPGRGARKLLAFLARRGKAVRLRGDAWIAGTTWERVVDGLRREATAGDGWIDVPRFKEIFGLTRKWAIPLLEALDDAGITRRAGDRRKIQV